MSLARWLLLLLPCAPALAQEPAAFVPPAAYPLDRYEAGWNKNPFTLKTAPVVVAAASFAVDLAIGSYYGDEENPTVVIVNTKTNKRIPLKKGVVDSSGMKLNSISYAPSRKDVTADVTLGSETATLHFNDSYTKQLASAESAKVPPAGQQQQGIPGQQGRPHQGVNPAAQTQNQRPVVPVPALPVPNQGAGGQPPGVNGMQGGGQAPFAQPTYNPGQPPRNNGGNPAQTGQPAAPAPAVPARIRVVAPVTNPPVFTQ
ncbi:hypothetical protein [Prosthecobacter sp.]|uniref:hypothetical protein n=1 Tax=Prosthecobacter sp. TaxID=1965333 RepID=UPI0037839604